MNWGSDVIDWSRVSELHEEVGDDALGEVLELFSSEVAEGLARLAQANSATAIAAEFHFLKGAALNLGLDEVAQICAKGEENARNGVMTEAQRLAVTEQFPASCQELSSQWRDRIGAN
ncbi:MAG: HPt domain protein [Roseibaca calidilacus]|uniref:HPt (Histidine-containing phosphotransfer) domain-containing protein n=1 Tax=Roseibaca calidilacus TaxID=1666912 RepID=A0A0N8K7P9_9RHOB|nr:MAG: HPt domain protein [Roseibaca calidilacus]CUX79640.1 HPt (histidine-containing phosphotransfer) domain-containing protein [Roseibaca calidilacus]